jgi:hypothetical protein
MLQSWHLWPEMRIAYGLEIQSEDGEVFRSIIFSGSACILVKMHIEHPMQLILGS